MPTSGTRLIRFALMGLLVATLAACGLPRSGPTRGQLLESSIEAQKGGSTYIIEVTDGVAQATRTSSALGFGSAFAGAGVIGSDDIRPGDRLGLMIWENVDDGLLANMGTNSTALHEIQVDGAGYIFVPYAGRIKAAGNSPEALRQIITNRLASQTPDPQVTVARVGGDGATVTVMGKVGAQGVYPIERPTRTLSAMLARAGGPVLEPDVTQIVVKRGGNTGRIWLTDLYSNSRNDIALRGGDVVIVEEDKRKFQALGALGQQSLVPFKLKTVNALDAMAMVGGLNGNLADPTGVFILRDENPSLLSAMLGDRYYGGNKVAYIIDLTKPDGLFMAREFVIRDNDTVYVTEAPYVQWQKTVGAIAGTANSVNTLNNVATGK